MHVYYKKNIMYDNMNKFIHFFKAFFFGGGGIAFFVIISAVGPNLNKIYKCEIITVRKPKPGRVTTGH